MSDVKVFVLVPKELIRHRKKEAIVIIEPDLDKRRNSFSCSQKGIKDIKSLLVDRHSNSKDRLAVVQYIFPPCLCKQSNFYKKMSHRILILSNVVLKVKFELKFLSKVYNNQI